MAVLEFMSVLCISRSIVRKARCDEYLVTKSYQGLKSVPVLELVSELEGYGLKIDVIECKNKDLWFEVYTGETQGLKPEKKMV